MYQADDQLRMPEDVRLCNCCGQWVPLSEFRRRSRGGIANECRDCHNTQRAVQLRRQRAKVRQKEFQSAIAAVNDADTRNELDAACAALLGLSRGLRGFAELFCNQFNQARPGSQMRTSMLLAAMRLLTEQAARADESRSEIQQMTDDQLYKVIADYHESS